MKVLDLGFGKCKMAVAGPKEMKDRIDKQNIMRVASKYPRIAREYFHKVKGQTVDIIKLNGSVELGPLVGLSDVIVDIVESGKTLKENGLDVLEEICDLSARLVVNRVSMKLKRDKIVDKINSSMAESRPVNKEIYNNNTISYKENLKQLDENFREIVKSGKRNTIVFGDRFHSDILLMNMD